MMLVALVLISFSINSPGFELHLGQRYLRTSFMTIHHYTADVGLLSSNVMWSCRWILIKSSPITHHGGAWGQRRYSSHSFLTSALDGGEWSASRPSCTLALGKGAPVPIVHEAGWAPELVWTQKLQEKSLCLRRGSNLEC
jgi:hypothetical protein